MVLKYEARQLVDPRSASWGQVVKTNAKTFWQRQNNYSGYYMPYDRKAYYQRTKKKQIATAVEWAKNNPERRRALTSVGEQGRRFRDPVGFLLGRTKWRAKQDGRDFDLERSDITIPEMCPILGIPLFFNEVNVNHEKNPNSPSIDRIDSSGGYTKTNILVCSWRANQLKSNGTLEEFKKLVEFMTQQAGIV